MAVKGNIPNIPNGVIGHIKADINVYNGVESESTKVTVDNRWKEIKVDVKEEFLDNKQDKLTAGENITIDENNVISATGGSGGSPIEAGNGIKITGEDTKTISIDDTVVATKDEIPDAVSGTNDGTNWTSLTIGEDTYGFKSDIDITEEEIEDYFDQYCNIHGKITEEIIEDENVNVLDLDNVESENNSSTGYITLDFNADNVSAGNKILNIE